DINEINPVFECIGLALGFIPLKSHNLIVVTMCSDIKEKSAVAFGLQGEEFGVEATARKQFIMGALFDDTAVGEDDDAVGHANRRETMRDDHRHAPGH